MEGNTRRHEIMNKLIISEQPISGTELAKMFSVSRQVIVGDIALLRAANKNILSTTKGYVLYKEKSDCIRQVFHVSHGSDEITDELNTIVDAGGEILNVIVEHEVYGPISVDLILKNRSDVDEFVNKINTKNATPLMGLTNGTHFHTVEASSEQILNRINRELSKKGYLISD